MNEYQLIVRFTRLHSEDDEIALKKYGEPLEYALRCQLAAELNAACRNGDLTGNFSVFVDESPSTQPSK